MIYFRHRYDPYQYCRYARNVVQKQNIFSRILFSEKRLNIHKLTVLTGKTVLLNSVQEFIETEVWLLLTFFQYLHNQLISIHSISRIKEYRCLKNVIHQIDINERLLLSAFQQGLRQNLSWFLS